MNGPLGKLARCAIYTRKSSEHNLDLAFSSLDAQREACEAYIKSQAHEGWRLIPDRYDDGAFSGASLERPALQQLLADVRAGTIDIVLVYKVDRLTRSLADFAKLIELFDAHSVSFVSVTQSFNTSSSMGRLTLNVLLSFAQFERELIGERVRDKIAASKRKGIWVGGPIPLGYAAVDKKIRVVPAEAEAVCTIFARYLELSSVRALAEDLDRRGIRSKPRRLSDGRTIGGSRFGVGHSRISSRTASTSAKWSTVAPFTVVNMSPFSIRRCLRRCRASSPPRRWHGAAGCMAHPRSWPAASLMRTATA
jgi:site-specific DNA recombinase